MFNLLNFIIEVDRPRYWMKIGHKEMIRNPVLEPEDETEQEYSVDVNRNSKDDTTNIQF